MVRFIASEGPQKLTAGRLFVWNAEMLSRVLGALPLELAKTGATGTGRLGSLRLAIDQLSGCVILVSGSTVDADVIRFWQNSVPSQPGRNHSGQFSRYAKNGCNSFSNEDLHPVLGYQEQLSVDCRRNHKDLGRTHI